MLTVTNDRGLSASTTQQIAVAASPAPTGDFTFSPTTPQTGQTVLFNADAIRAAAGHTIVQYSWIFGDGGTASGFLVSHAFGAAATYNVTLTVADEVGMKFTVTKAITVTSSGAAAPQANFTFSPSTPVRAGTQVTFDGSSSTAANGATIVSYQWNFGEVGGAGNTTTASPTATHTYATPGFYTVSLVVVDSLGRSSAAQTRQIQVQ
jgi:PKD repeat protein